MNSLEIRTSVIVVWEINTVNKSQVHIEGIKLNFGDIYCFDLTIA